MSMPDQETISNEALDLIRNEAEKRTPYQQYKDLDLTRLHSFRFKSGKWKDNTFAHVVNNDFEYCKWVLKNDTKISTLSTLYLFRHYLTRLLESQRV